MPEILSNVFFSPLYICGMLFTLGFMLKRFETLKTPESLAEILPLGIVKFLVVLAGLCVAVIIVFTWPILLGKHLGNRFFWVD
jgi:hypothetical protein